MSTPQAASTSPLPGEPFCPEYRFQTLFDQAPVSMQLLAADGRTLQVNKAWERLWERPGDSALKDHVLSAGYNILTDPQLRAKGITAYLERAFAGESVKIPAILYDPGEMGGFGRTRWVAATAYPLKDDAGSVQEVMLMHEDITEQIESQQRLFDSEERFRSLVMATSIIVWTTNADGMAVEDSPSWRAFTGQSADEWMGSGWLAAVHPEDRDHAAQVFLHSMRTNTLYQTEYRLRRADGEYCWTSAKAVPLFNPDGSVKLWVGANTDITHARTASQALRASEERLKLATEAGSIGIWDYDIVQDKVVLSGHACVILGLPPGQFEGSMGVFLALIHAADKENIIRDTAAKMPKGNSFSDEFRIVRPNGEVRWLANRAAIYRGLRDGRMAPVRMVGTLVDITERKHNEHALRESEMRFRTITDAMPQMVWSTRPDGYHEFYNQRWYEFTGVPTGSTDGEGWGNVVHPDDQEQAWAVWRHSLATGEPYEVRYRLRHRSGEYRWALGRARPLRDSGGRILRWMGTCTDIHDQKVAEDALREADRRKDEFLAMLAHELRNPLAPISAAAELMALGQLDAAHMRRTSQVINRQVRHMTALVNDLLDVSRVTRGLVEIDRSPQDLKLIASNALEQVMPLVESKQHQLSMDLSREPAHVLGDPKRLVQVLTNLLSNAAKYTPDGGHIHLGMEVQESRIVLRVRDDGIGIAPALQPKIFDLFVQAERTPDRVQGGLGIGLALVRSLVELHDGEVSCRSGGPGKGSEFVVTLPRLRDDGEFIGKQHPVPLVKAARPLDILIVDDNMDAATMLSMYLTAAGHEVCVEHSSRKALERVESALPDVCVLDIGLPEMDGYQLAALLKERQSSARMTLIAITGYGQRQDKQRAMAAGFDHHFTKPVDTARLAQLLSTLH